MNDALKAFAKALMDPATNMGTARWVIVGMCVYDIVKNHMSLVNSSPLLILAGADIAARWFDQTPTMRPPDPPVGPPAPPMGPPAYP